MTGKQIIEALSQKGADREAIAAEVLDDPELIPPLLAGLAAKAANVKYGSEKVLRLLSEKRPELLYPHFDRFVGLLEKENKFMNWGGIMILANLATVDSGQRIEQILDRYLAPIRGTEMVTAANIIVGAAKIARAKPALTERIVKEILEVEKAGYLIHGRLSPECNNVVCGHAVAVLSDIYGQIQDKKRVRDFMERQLQNSRAAVRRKAKVFLKTVQDRFA